MSDMFVVCQYFLQLLRQSPVLAKLSLRENGQISPKDVFSVYLKTEVEAVRVQKSLLWRQLPPAIFPVCLGLMGLGLGWRNASDVLPIAHEIGDLLLGLSTAYFLCFLTLYCAKVLARPSVIFEDMVKAPARAGVAAGAMCMMILAAALLPLGISVPQVWWTGVILQILASAVVCLAIWRDPPHKRRFTPFQFLTFVGPVVGPIAGIPLGYVTESLLLTLAALIAFIVIAIGYGLRLRRDTIPLGMRPALVIFLSPNCLFAISFSMLGYEPGFWLFYVISSLVAFGFVVLTPWLTRGGWTPVWASFTFPLTAFVQVQIIGMQMGAGALATIGVFVGLAVSTPVVLIISYRFALEWLTGELAVKSGAARA